MKETGRTEKAYLIKRYLYDSEIETSQVYYMNGKVFNPRRKSNPRRRMVPKSSATRMAGIYKFTIFPNPEEIKVIAIYAHYLPAEITVYWDEGESKKYIYRQ
ncbi:MAG: hypothetical protein ACK5LC_03725 [Coprobacillaceae bacterium]